MNWYVIYQDGIWVACDGETEVFTSKKKALEELYLSQLEDRKKPSVQRIETGYYRYVTSKKQEDWKTFNIVNEKQFVKQGFYQLIKY
jgi:hypothetical protein